MDIHKPHAAKNWREFFIELATITAGILIALALEQVVETVREHRHAAEARESIRTEIANGLGLMNVRSAIETCVTKRLDEVTDHLDRLAAGKAVPAAIWIGHPTIFSMRSSQFDAASHAGTVSHLPIGEQTSFAEVYAAFADYSHAEATEQGAWSDLRVLEQNPHYTPTLDWQLRSAIQLARTARWTLEIESAVAMAAAAKIGISPEDLGIFKTQSACVPFTTPRQEALEKIVEGRSNKAQYDEP